MYTVEINQTGAVLHPVRNVAGTLMTGQAAFITSALVDPAGASSALAVSIVEVGATGRYGVSLTPNVLGLWNLTLTNPPASDGLVTDYVLDVRTAAQMLAATGALLTSRDRVKRHIWPRQSPATENTVFDTTLDLVLSEVSDRMHKEMGRYLPETVYTEYYDGNGTDLLTLRQGPLASVTSLHEVEYGDNGSGTRTETLTAINQADRLEHGLRSEGWLGLSGLRLLSGCFVPGRRNYKVVYTAGFGTLPEAVVRAATIESVFEFKYSDHWGFAEKTVGEETSFRPFAPQTRDDALARALAPFSVQGIA